MADTRSGPDPVADRDEPTDLRAWRARTLETMLRLVFVMAVITAVPSVGYSWFSGRPEILVFDVLALAALGLVTFLRAPGFRLRSLMFLGLVFLLGVWFLPRLLLVGVVYLVALPVLAALLLGLRAGLAGLGVSFLSILVVGWPAVATGAMANPVPLGSWLVMLLNFAFASAILTIGCAVLLDRLEEALESQSDTLESLQASRAELEATNRELAVEVAVRRRTEAEKARLAAAVERTRQPVLVADPDGRVFYANPASRVLFGEVDPTAGMLLDALAPPADTAASILAAMDERRTWQGQVRPVPDGTEREFEASIELLTGADGTDQGQVAVIADLTRERAMERRLRQSEKLEALGTFAGGIAHDFNNIIGSILALAEDMRAEPDRLPAEHIDGIEQACNRAREVVRQVLAFGRAGEELERRPARLGDLIRESLPLLRAVLPAGIELDVRIRDEGGVRIAPSDLNQILLNLAHNAARAMQDHPGGMLSLTLERVVAGSAACGEHPRVNPDVEHLCLAVTDTGEGIPEAIRSRIFDPFFTTREPGEGTGLGLASVHGLVTTLGGVIGVESEPGRGTRFSILLPEVEPDEDVEPDSRADAGVEETLADDAARILLVDDEALILEMTARGLVRAGFAVTRAMDGLEAMALLSTDPEAFELLITDMNMPGCSGMDLITHARELRPGLPALLTSGLNVDPPPDAAGDAPFDRLDKPYRQDELVQRVRGLLAQSRL
jgi:PAS domain S-box-containing protein